MDNTRTVTAVTNQDGRFLTTLSPCGHLVLFDHVHDIGASVTCQVCALAILGMPNTDAGSP
ncbi:MAG TPA: hypothetical protein VNM37_02350 [Candidatus Dormibacteraeota bacterium]|nr:hypothetical protein [Candidatus Dormibacteraeota bacterium]